MIALMELGKEFWPIIVAIGAWLAFMAHGYREKREGVKQGYDKATNQIEEQTDEAIERVREVDRDTANLNDDELRKLAESSRHNRSNM